MSEKNEPQVPIEVLDAIERLAEGDTASKEDLKAALNSD